MKITVRGQDARMRRLASLISEGGETWGFDAVLLLPIPSTRDGIHINGTNEAFDSVEQIRGEGRALAVGYSLPVHAADALRRAGYQEILDLARDDAFADGNTALTTLAALGHILSVGGRALPDMTIGICGYGRLGKSLCRVLLFLGARVIVWTSDTGVRRSLGAYGIATRYREYGSPVYDLSGVDVFINTAPCPCLTDGADTRGITVIELASGDNFPGREDIIRLPSLPAREYPESAARLCLLALRRYAGSGDGEDTEGDK